MSFPIAPIAKKETSITFLNLINSDQLMLNSPPKYSENTSLIEVSLKILNDSPINLSRPKHLPEEMLPKFKVINYDMPKWNSEKSNKVENIPPSLENNKGQISTKWLNRLEGRTQKLWNLGVPFSKDNLSELLYTIGKLKFQLKHETKNNSAFRLFNITIKHQNFPILVFDRSKKDGKDIFLLDPHFFAEGQYKKVYKLWLLSKATALTACAISSINNTKAREIAVRDLHFFDIFNRKVIPNSNQKITPELFKSIYANTNLLSHQGEMQITIMEKFSCSLYTKKDECLTKKQVVDYALPLATIYKFFHDFDICYRDTKLENILLSNNGELVLCDYGYTSHSNDSDYLSSKYIQGTLDYLPYEILYGKDPKLAEMTEADRKQWLKSVDIWSFGYLLSELFKIVPWVSEFDKHGRNINYNSMKKLMEKYSEKPLTPNCPEEKLIAEMLNLDQKKRPTIDQVIKALEEIKIFLELKI